MRCMYTFLFRNKLGALGFVVLMMISAATLVGTEEHDGVIVKTTQEIAKQRSDFAEKVDAMSSPKKVAQAPAAETASVEIEFTPDEELVDDAQGFDPTPEPPQPDVNPEPIAAGNLAEEGEVVIILNGEEYVEPL